MLKSAISQTSSRPSHNLDADHVPCIVAPRPHVVATALQHPVVHCPPSTAPPAGTTNVLVMPHVTAAGKRPGWSLAATGATGLSTSRLFHITDRVTGAQFLVDTGAEVSVIPPSPSERHKQPHQLTLQAVNNSSIKTFGKRSLTLELGLRRTFRWVFIIADIPRPILGADFLRHFGLLVDIRHRRLSDSLTKLRVQGISYSSPSPAILPRHPPTIYHNLLSEFPSLIQPCTSQTPPKYSVTHHIETTGPPCSLVPADSAPLVSE